MKRKRRVLCLSLVFIMILSMINTSIVDNSIINIATPEYAYGASVDVPEIKAIAAVNSKTLVVSWSKVENASSYELYRSESKDGTYKFIKDTKYLTYKNNNFDKKGVYEKLL